MTPWYFVIVLCLVDGFLCHELMKAWDREKNLRKAARKPMLDFKASMRRCKATHFYKGIKTPVEGLFHQWAQQFEDCGDAGVGNYTVAIIELDDGRVVECMPDTVVFLDREEEQTA